MNQVRGRVAVVALAVGLAGATQAVSAQGSDPIRLTKPVRATEFDISPARTYLTPYFSIDPEEPLNVAGAFIESRTKRCGFMRSSDGGQTWTRLDSSPSPPSYPFCLMNNSHTFQGKVEYGRNGDLYYALSGWDTQDAPRRSVFLSRSSDRGDSWSPVAVSDARPTQPPDNLDERPISGFAVDTKTGDADSIYLTWRRQYPGQTAPNSRAPSAMVNVSTDGGRSFGQPVDLSAMIYADPAKRQEAVRSAPTTTAPAPTTTSTTPSPAQGPLEASPTTTVAAAPSPTTTTTAPPNSRAGNKDAEGNYGGTNPSVTVGNDGTVYVAWVATYTNVSPRPYATHFLSKSSDKGRTWTHTQITPYSEQNVNTFGSAMIAWSAEGGDKGSLHMLYEGSKRPEVANETDIFYVRSTDDGATWSEAKVLNDDDPAKFNASLMPNIKVAPNGRLDVAWFDTRDDPGVTANDVYHSSSTDNGNTWSKNTRVTDRSIDRRFGPFAANFDLNGPPALASVDSYTLIGWDDTRFGDPTTETQDIFTSAVQYSEVGGESRALSYVFAGVLGLLLVGLILLLGSLATKRRDGSGTGASGAATGARQTAPTTR